VIVPAIALEEAHFPSDAEVAVDGEDHARSRDEGERELGDNLHFALRGSGVPNHTPAPRAARVRWGGRVISTQRPSKDLVADPPTGSYGGGHVAKPRGQHVASVGIAEHGNSAVIVTLTRGGELLDRRRIDLTRDLPTHPYHHEGSWAVGRYLNSPWARSISLAEAVALVERVRVSAARGARVGLEALAATVHARIETIAIRACPELPPTTEERIADTRAANVADSVMYREALAKAAEARGWSVHWYDRVRVFRDAAAALGREDIEAFLQAIGRTSGPPWQAKHKLAAAAALAGGARK
jgi:hypothetical protein